MRCARCFALHYAGATVCSRCGATLGLEASLGVTEHRCPHCRDETTLIAIQLDEHRLEECAKCTGVFVDHVTLERVSRRSEADRGVRALPPAKASVNAAAPVVYRKCPSCDDVMTRRNFGSRSGVIVDVCTKHGVWFDAEELTRILEFIASGGSERERMTLQQERERAEQLRKRIESVTARPGDIDNPERAGVFADIAAVVLDFIIWH